MKKRRRKNPIPPNLTLTPQQAQQVQAAEALWKVIGPFVIPLVDAAERQGFRPLSRKQRRAAKHHEHH